MLEDAIEASQQISFKQSEKGKIQTILDSVKEKANEKLNYAIGVVPQIATFIEGMKQLK